MVFVESSDFERYLPRYLSDEEYGQLQPAFMNNPQLGAVIPGSGGVRKLAGVEAVWAQVAFAFLLRQGSTRSGC